MALSLDPYNPPPAGQPVGGSSGALSSYYAAVGQTPGMSHQPFAPRSGGGGGGSDNPMIVLSWFQTRMMSGDSTPRGFGVESMPVLDTNGKRLSKLQMELEKSPYGFKKQMAFFLTLGGFGIPSGPGTPIEKAWAYANSMTLAELMEAHEELLMATYNHQQAGQRITPDQMLSQAIKFRLPMGIKWNGDLNSLMPVLGKAAGGPLGDEIAGTSAEDVEPEPFTGVVKQTQISTDIMDPADARALVRALLMNELGREPTEAEFEDFTSAALAAQKRNPTKTVNRSFYEEDELVKQTSRTDAGITMAGVADRLTDKARRQPDWAEWQAVGTYAPALFAALGSTVPGT